MRGHEKIRDMQKGKNTGHVRLNNNLGSQVNPGYVYLIFSRSWHWQ